MSYEDHPHATYSVRHVFSDGTIVRSLSGNLHECKVQFVTDVLTNVQATTAANGKRGVVLFHEHKDFPIYVFDLDPPSEDKEEDDHPDRIRAIRGRVQEFVSGELSRARNRAEENELASALNDRAGWINYAHGIADGKTGGSPHDPLSQSVPDEEW